MADPAHGPTSAFAIAEIRSTKAIPAPVSPFVYLLKHGKTLKCHGSVGYRTVGRFTPVHTLNCVQAHCPTRLDRRFVNLRATIPWHGLKVGHPRSCECRILFRVIGDRIEIE